MSEYGAELMSATLLESPSRDELSPAFCPPTDILASPDFFGATPPPASVSSSDLHAALKQVRPRERSVNEFQAELKHLAQKTGALCLIDSAGLTLESFTFGGGHFETIAPGRHFEAVALQVWAFAQRIGSLPTSHPPSVLRRRARRARSRHDRSQHGMS